MDTDDLARRLHAFVDERDWGQFHDAKNLAMALAAEGGELLEVFQWKTTTEVRGPMPQGDVDAAAEELADILIYVIRLSDVLGVDLGEAVENKLAMNEERYPVNLAKGNAVKHDRRPS